MARPLLPAALLFTAALLGAPPGAGAQDGPPPPTEASARADADQAPTGARASIVGTVRVRPEDGGGALIHAMVTVRDPGGGLFSAFTDSAGAYRIDGVAPGTVRVRATHVAYRESSLEVVVPPGETVDLELELSTHPLELRGLVIRDERRVASAPEEADTPDLVPYHVRMRLLELSPGLAEAGLADGDPPSGSPGDPGNVLLMRGSTADLKLVLLDGAPVYAPFHLGGLLPGFEPGLFARAEHHTGGAPARYDGGLSYILDLRTRSARPDRMHAEASVDALSVGGTVEAPLGRRAGVLFSGRALHRAVSSTLLGGHGSPYGYHDALLRLDGRLGGSSLGVTLFSNRESVFLDLERGLGGEPAGGDIPVGAETGDARWGNDAVSAFWRGTAGGLDLEVTGARSRYRAGLPLHSPVQSVEEDGGVDSVTVISAGRTDRTRITVDAARPSGAAAGQFGLAFDRIEVAYGAWPADPFAELGARAADGTVLGGYLEGLRPLTDDLDLEYGLRLDHFRPGGFRAAPRLTVLWRLGSTARLTLTAGRYHQLARRGGVDADLGVGPGVETGTGFDPRSDGESGSLLQVARADHLVGTLEQRLGETVHLSTELFLKDFRNVPGIGTRHLASSGVDLQVLHRGGERTAWVGYSLAWFWEPEAEPSRFSGRHLLSVGLDTPLIGPVGAAFRGSFSDGLPLTAVRFDGGDPGVTRPQGTSTGGGGGGDAGTTEPAQRPVDGFLRMDAELFAEWTTERPGRAVRIRPYLRVLNALDRRDALFHYFEPWREDSLRPLVEVPFLPVLGLAVRF